MIDMLNAMRSVVAAVHAVHKLESWRASDKIDAAWDTINALQRRL